MDRPGLYTAIKIETEAVNFLTGTDRAKLRARNTRTESRALPDLGSQQYIDALRIGVPSPMFAEARMMPASPVHLLDFAKTFTNRQQTQDMAESLYWRGFQQRGQKTTRLVSDGDGRGRCIHIHSSRSARRR